MAPRNNAAAQAAAQRERERQQRERQQRERQQRERQQRERQQREREQRERQQRERQAQQQRERQAQQQRERQAQQQRERQAQQQRERQQRERQAQQQSQRQNQGNVKKVIRQAGENISRSEMKQITKAAGGDVKKAINRIASVQEKMKQKDGVAPNLASGAANMLIKQAEKTPQVRYDPKGQFGTSKLGQTLQGMVAQPATSGTMIKGQQVGATPAQAGSLVPGGMVIRPGGNLAVKKTGTTTPQVTPPPETPLPVTPPPEPEPQPNPNQDILDAIASLQEENATLRTNFDDFINQSTLAAEQQAAQMQEMFNAQVAQQEAAYQQQLQQANLLAQQEQQAARAFMINQGRMMSPADLQIGATYGTPQLPGTQGFKYRPQPTTAQVATAFTAPTLAAAAMTPQQQLQPTVLNV